LAGQENAVLDAGQQREAGPHVLGLLLVVVVHDLHAVVGEVEEHFVQAEDGELHVALTAHDAAQDAWLVRQITHHSAQQIQAHVVHLAQFRLVRLLLHLIQKLLESSLIEQHCILKK